MKKIPLTRGYEAIVDDDDYDWLMQWRWHANVNNKRVYACRHATDRTQLDKNGKHKHIMILMHRQIVGVSDGYNVRHLDGNKLNNRRSNLTECTRSASIHSRKPKKGLIYKGVNLDRARKSSWTCDILKDGQPYQVRGFKDAISAARCYDVLAKLLYGEFASLNFPESDPLTTITEEV